MTKIKKTFAMIMAVLLMVATLPVTKVYAAGSANCSGANSGSSHIQIISLETTRSRAVVSMWDSSGYRGSNWKVNFTDFEVTPTESDIGEWYSQPSGSKWVKCDSTTHSSHLHNWQYGKSDTKLKIWCNGSDCTSSATDEAHAAVLTISAPSQAFTGVAITPSITYGSSDEQTAWTDATGSSVPSSANTTKKYFAAGSDGNKTGSELSSISAVGNYVIEVTFYSSVTVSVPFTITPLKIGESNTYWNLNGGILTISGNGDMPDYDSYTETPWYSNNGNIQSVVISEGVTRVGNCAFGGDCDKLESVLLPASLTSIGDNAFANTAMQTVSIPAGVTSIGVGAFQWNQSLTTITFEEGSTLTSIPELFCSNCDLLTSVNLPLGVTDIGDKAFIGCGFTSFELPTNLESIGEWAFFRSKLTSITIPATVTNIKNEAFRNCSDLTSVVFQGTVGTDGSGIHNKAFVDVGTSGVDKTTLELPAGMTGPANNATAWHSGYFKFTPKHAHDWKYTVGSGDDANKLTAKCEGVGDCNVENGKTTGVSLTLSASSPTYSGSATTITIGTDAEKVAWEAARLTVPTTVTYEKADGTALTAAPTTEGNYVAKVSPVGITASSNNTAKVSFKIDKKPDDSKPDDSKPDDSKPDDSKPDDSKPDDIKPDESESEEINYYDEVKTSDGVVKDITNTGEAPKETNPYTTTIVNSSELETLVNVTSEEKAQGVNIWVKIVEASSTMPVADKEMINKTAGTNTVGMFFDASLFKKVGDNEEEAIHDVNGKIKLSFVVPEMLRRDGRNYEIIRVHDGVATAIAGTYDATTHTFTFETDKFSSYALIYNDEVAVVPAAGVTATVAAATPAAPAATPAAPAATPAAPASVSPKTGDNSNVFAWMLVMIAGLGVFGYGFFMRKKEN